MTEEAHGVPTSSESLASLMNVLEGTDVEEVHIRLGESEIRVHKEPGQPIPAKHEEVAEASTAAEEVAVAAPLTGVYYARPSPDQEPFVAEGADIIPGQVVALIETMKLFNEVVSEVAGRVLRITATEGDLVEKGQTLIQVHPSDETV